MRLANCSGGAHWLADDVAVSKGLASRSNTAAVSERHSRWRSSVKNRRGEGRTGRGRLEVGIIAARGCACRGREHRYSDTGTNMWKATLMEKNSTRRGTNNQRRKACVRGDQPLIWARVIFRKIRKHRSHNRWAGDEKSVRIGSEKSVGESNRSRRWRSIRAGEGRTREDYRLVERQTQHLVG